MVGFGKWVQKWRFKMLTKASTIYERLVPGGMCKKNANEFRRISLIVQPKNRRYFGRSFLIFRPRFRTDLESRAKIQVHVRNSLI